jgi:hypothetical protein
MLTAVRESWRRMRAESLIARPGTFGAMGELRDEVLALRRAAETVLAEADDELRRAADARLAAMARLRACNRALVGTGQVAGQQYLLRRSDAVEDPLPDPATLEVVEREELRELLVDLLCAMGRPVSVRELTRLLAAHGFTTSGRPSQTISNALRTAIADGDVERVARGSYRAV